MDPARFYDSLAGHSHLIHEDWERAIEVQGEQLDAIIREFAPGARTVLDCACGIGTQALGLAARGYSVTGSDIAEAALARAREEAARRGLAIDFATRDMREIEGDFDVVLAADNSVTHLLTDDDLLAAFRAFRRCARRACLLTVRDYATMDTTGIHVQGHAAHRIGETLVSVYQVREHDGDHYTIHLYVVEDGDTCTTRVARSRYYAAPVDRLLGLLREAGFDDARRLDGRFFQPVLVAR